MNGRIENIVLRIFLGAGLLLVAIGIIGLTAIFAFLVIKFNFLLLMLPPAILASYIVGEMVYKRWHLN